ncbi:ras-related and estrogen-regulated growth inhibitor-like [Dermacentor variabilis]|uniref:ras-related and estrogen-regulated growth inhibitor-like n=1 Tax=Dermacentor variabilis TaxID=34621 RepID=UPI003F5CB2A4
MEEDAATTLLAPLEPINLVVIGKDGTGKTALIVRLLTRRFIHEYDPSLVSVYPFTIEDDGEALSLNLMDTAGKSRLESSEVDWGDGFLLVVSLTSPESVRTAELMYAWLQDSAPGKPLALAATKRDLVQARAVSSHELAELAERWHCALYETAATGDYEDVARPFLELARRARTLKARRQLFPNMAPEPVSPPPTADGSKRLYRARQLTK